MPLELTQLGETGGWGKGCLLGLRRSVAVGDSQTAARRPRSMAPTAKSEEKDELTCPFFFFFRSGFLLTGFLGMCQQPSSHASLRNAGMVFTPQNLSSVIDQPLLGSSLLSNKVIFKIKKMGLVGCPCACAFEHFIFFIRHEDRQIPHVSRRITTKDKQNCTCA